MGYCDFGDLPVSIVLASGVHRVRSLVSSVPGPTWTNRLFVQSGTSLGRVEMPEPPFDLDLHHYNQDTMDDRLNEGKNPGVSTMATCLSRSSAAPAPTSQRRAKIT